MSSNEPRDDEILGRALSRAIETAEVEETPYDRSRIALRPLRRGASFWGISALATSAALVAIAIATVLATPASAPAAEQPTSPVSPSRGPVTPSPVATAVPSPAAPTIDRDRIYFARRDLPPIGVHINDMPRADADATSRIAHRISALLIDDTVTPPPDAFTARPARGTVTAVGDVKVTSDTVRIDLGVPTANGDWNVPDLDAVPLRQQIVYTATEEAGIRYVIVTQNGGQPARIGSFSLGSPISREDVSGYPRVSQQLMGESWPAECGPTPCPTVATARLSNSYSVDAVGRGVARFEVRIESGQTTGSVNLDIRQGDERKSPWAGKYILELDVRGADPKQGVEIVDRAPLRSVRTGGLGDVATYELALDDLRPWRVVITGDRIIIDIGGVQPLVTGTVLVYAPSRGDTLGRQFTVSGLSRTFEATTAWRVRDLSQRIVASGVSTATRGTSQLWGLYQFTVQLPSSVGGPVTLEVYWQSPRDGTDTDVVQVPLMIR